MSAKQRFSQVRSLIAMAAREGRDIPRSEELVRVARNELLFTMKRARKMPGHPGASLDDAITTAAFAAGRAFEAGLSEKERRGEYEYEQGFYKKRPEQLQREIETVVGRSPRGKSH
jgi:hypothetical protein